MRFSEVVDQARALLQRTGTLTYRVLKREFALDDESLEDLKDQFIKAEEVAIEKDGTMLVWTGGVAAQEMGKQGIGEPTPSSALTAPASRTEALREPRVDVAERRQLTVMFCDLVGSTTLSTQLDPEDFRDLVRAYQQTCAEVIQRHDGSIAQYLGDGLLVYFGYPVAHEDEALRAVRAGLEIIDALKRQETGAGSSGRLSGLQVRIGIHTGPVVVGEIGGERREVLALGETPNLAARIQGQAAPQEVLVSNATLRLLSGLVETEARGLQELKGLSSPVALYRVVGESRAQNRLDAALPSGLTPLVGREEELSLLQRCWEQASEREGQVVLLSGEPGIGKSRLVRELRDRTEQDHAIRIEFRCSPYYQHSALQPIIDHLQRLLHWQKDETLQSKLDQLHATLTRYRFPQADTLALLAALLSLPHPPDAPPLNLSPQRQKQKTEEALLAWLLEEAEQAPVYCVWEDVHWADPSTLELLGRLIDYASTTRLFVLLTSRPEFLPPWGKAGHYSQLMLSRLGRRHVSQLIEKAASGQALPAEVVQQIVAKTDGVPLFVEELTKMVVESGLLTATTGGYTLSGPLPPLAIPSTLQDSLMARLDRLASVREIAQLGATIGREFSYELLHAVSPLDERVLQQGLRQLIEAELLYQRGTPPQSSYLFKHALIQDTAYHSLLKSTRQQYHHQIARMLEAHFPNTQETQPELLAHHYTEAGFAAQAVPYWQQAGQHAVQRSAYQEAIHHLTKGLDVLKTLPDTPERIQHELPLQLALADAWLPVKGYTAPEVGKTVLRARALCQQLDEPPQLFSVLFRLMVFYINRGEPQTAYELAQQLLRLAQHGQDRYLLSLAHAGLGWILYWLGELPAARTHVEQALALYDPQQHPRHTVGTADLRVNCLSYASWILWRLGYPERGLKKSQEAVAITAGLSHPLSLTYATGFAAMLHLLRREGSLGQERAEAVLSLATEQGFPYWVALGTIRRGGALALQAQEKEGIPQLCQGLAASRAMGADIGRTDHLALLGEAYGNVGQGEEGLSVLTEALAFMDNTGERVSEAELYRLKGELTLTSHVAEAEVCFQRAIEVARRQSAKSLELRATMSLARLWQQQGKQHEAHKMLVEIYSWFTEGFDTKDLQEAKGLLAELREEP